MITQLRRIPRWQKITAAVVNPIVDRLNTLSRISGTGGTRVTVGPSGVNIQGSVISAAPSKIFEVQSAATGDGVYNCYEQTFDATDWSDTTGADRLDVKNTDSIEVFNLFENDPESTYAEMLAAGDRLKAWQIRDDEGNSRWVGVPISGGLVRRAKTTAAAGSSKTITCNLIKNDGTEATSGLGAGITVNCDIADGGTALDAAIPRLRSGEMITVVNIQGKWYCTTVFQPSEDCVCTSP